MRSRKIGKCGSSLRSVALASSGILLAMCGSAALAGQLPVSAFQAYDPASASTIVAGPLALYTVSVGSIMPTQASEGYSEVGKKTAGFDLLSPAQLRANLLTDIEPVIIGPGGQLYLTDGHHTFTALDRSIYGASNPAVYVDVIANYANLTTAQFYATLQANNFLLPLNNGVPETVTATGAPLPTSLTGLTNDPYRGLEYSILKNKSSALFTTAANITGAIGASTPGLDKMAGYYLDFFEAAAYRNANGGLGLPTLSPGDIALSTQWNLNPASVTTLPNVAGTVTAAQLPGFILNQNIVNAGGITNATLATGAIDGNGTFTGITTINAGTPAAPITIGTPNVGLIMQLGADRGFSVTLNGTNSYTGGTSIMAGHLIVQGDTALGAATPAGATIDPANVAASVRAANGIVFNSLSEGNGTLTLGAASGGTFTTNRPIAVGGETATIDVNTNNVALTGQLVSLGTAGIGIGNATGFSDLTIDDLTGGATGHLTLSTASPYFYGNIIIGNSGAPTVTVMNDAALGNTAGSAISIGQVDLNGGTLQAGASFAAPERNLFLGSGSAIDVNGFTTSWGTLTNVQRTLKISNSSTTTPGAITFNSLTIGAASTLQLAGGTAGETVTLTNGITRPAQDTLIIQPGSNSSLGVTDKLLSGAGAASLVNTIAPAWIVTNNGAGNSAGPYDFVTYGPNGYVKATYGATTLTGGGGTSVVALGANATLAGNAAAYALNTEGKTIALGGNTLTIGDGTNSGGLILASGSAISNGTLAFGGSEGVIWLSGANPTISAAITGSKGLTFSGSGAVTINSAANVSGLVTIDAGTVTLSGANIFANDIAGVLLDDTKSKPAAATLAITANNSFTTLNTVGANSAINISNGAVLTLGDTTNNLGSTINTTIKETGAVTAGALTLNGSGLFDVSAAGKNALNFVAGSTVVVNNSAKLRVVANQFANANFGVVLNGTSQLQFAQNGGSVFANAVSGTGALHLIGGTLKITGTSSTYTGGTIVETGSTLDITTASLPIANANVTNAGGTVLFDQATTGSYGGVISDGPELGIGPVMAGTLVKDDSTGGNTGNVTLAQAQQFTGATYVEAGTLTLGAVDALATSSGVDLGRVGGGATAALALAANNTIKALSSEASNTSTVQLGANALTINTASGVTSNFRGGIAGAGSVTVTGAGTQVFSGANSYGGGTTVNGGTLALTGAGTLGAAAGTLAVNAGTLDLGGTTQTTGTLTLAGGTIQNGTLAATSFNVQSGAVNAVLGGTGGLVKSGSGTVTLGAVNSYTGATDIQAGTLQLGVDNALSASTALTVEAGATLDLNTHTDTVGSFALYGTLTGGGLLTANATNLLYGGTLGMALSGSTVNQVSGTTLVTGTIAAGNLVLTGGTLQLGASNRLATTTAVTVNPGATFDLQAYNNTVASLALSGTLAGTGTLTAATYALNGATVNANLGAGTLTNSGGTSTLNGTAAAAAVTVTGGTLALGSASRLASNAALSVSAGGTFNLGGTAQTVGSLSGAGTVALGTGAFTDAGTGGDTAFTGDISGTGTFTKTGASTLTLAGPLSLTGRLELDGGTTLFSGSTAGSVRVAGGTLAGTPSIAGNLSLASGTISPGSTTGAVGTIQAGSLTVSGGTIAVDAVGSSGNFASDTIKITGAATLSGGTVKVSAAEPLANYGMKQDYVLVQAGSVSGTFANTGFTQTSNDTSLYYSLRYDIAPNEVVLELRKQIDLSQGLGTTGSANQYAVAGALTRGELTGSDAYIAAVGRIASLTPAQQAATFSSLSGENTANITTAAINASTSFTNMLRDRLAIGGGSGDKSGNLLAGLFGNSAMFQQARIGASMQNPSMAVGGTSPFGGSDTPHLGVWLQAFGTSGSLDGRDGTSKLIDGSTGIAIGLDAQFGLFRIGGAYAADHLDTKVRALDSTSGGTIHQGALYAAYDDGRAYANAIGSYFSGSQGSSRTVFIGGASIGQADARYHLNGWSGAAAAGYRILLSNGVRLTPQADFSATRVKRDAFSETGIGVFSLDVAKDDRTAYTAGGELRLSKPFSLGGGTVEPYIGGGVVFNLSGRSAVSVVRFDGAPTESGTFLVDGAALPREAARITGGLQVQATTRVSFGIGAEALLANRQHEGAVNMHIRYGF